MCNSSNALIPQAARVARIHAETSDVKTFHVTDASGKIPFAHLPGQCAMLGIPGVGEAIFSIASPPADAGYLAFSVKAVGKLTRHMHNLPPGAPLTLRGPYGTPFPVNGAMMGRDLLFIAGGIGIAPLRSAIKHVFANRSHYGAVDIVYGANSASDLVYANEVRSKWPSQPDTRIRLTVDKNESGWGGHVGFVPAYLSELGFAPEGGNGDRIALICGPPIMIKYSLEALAALGFKKSQAYTTLEMRMKCGVGTCGRCNIGHKYVCRDGPVFRCDELEELPDEY
jgi:NAD(P)H-flavin reductase